MTRTSGSAPAAKECDGGGENQRTGEGEPRAQADVADQTLDIRAYKEIAKGNF